MITFSPFKALTPPSKYAHEVASPPYDVIDRQEARVYIKDKPYSLLRVTRPDALLDDEISLYASEAYDRAFIEFQRLINAGRLERDEEACYYAYSQQMGDHIQIGLVGLATAEDYWADRIKKHEFTLPKKEDDRMRQIETLCAHLGPIFLTYHTQERIDQVVADVTSRSPEVELTAEDGVIHRIWSIRSLDHISQIRNNFSNLEAFYIADGHHRAAAAARVAQGASVHSQRGKFLAVAFPHSQLQILSYNRVVEHLNGRSPQEFMESLEEHFHLTPLSKAQSPSHPQSWSMYLSGSWYEVSMRDHLSKVIETRSVTARLDVSILQDEILSPLLGVEDPRTSSHIKFVGGIRGLDVLAQSALKTNGVAFSLYPTSIEELMSIADEGQVMPPKSTWFEPKLRSGLFINTFDDEDSVHQHSRDN